MEACTNFKICSKCNQTKDKSCFGKRKITKDGHNGICKQCKKVIMAEYYVKNRKSMNAKQRLYRATSTCKERARAYRLKVRFGITIEKYNNMFIEQGGCCAICGVHQAELNKRLEIDHCHKTGDIRGLLCNICNKGLGAFKDNLEIARNAVKYLEMAGDGDA